MRPVSLVNIALLLLAGCADQEPDARDAAAMIDAAVQADSLRREVGAPGEVALKQGPAGQFVKQITV
jgi:hypothetical protein